MLLPRRCIQLLAGLALLAPALASAPAAAQGGPEIGAPFTDYYAAHQGLRVLGHPLTEVHTDVGYPMQYFEKGRIEDHRFEIQDPTWAFMYGRLTAELMVDRPDLAVSGTTLTYGQLAAAGDARFRRNPPAGFTGGTQRMADGGVFVPVDAALHAAPGYVVASSFWSYINQAALFPGGWLHDVGLPLTDPLTAQVSKHGELRAITVQAFERTVLTYDARNPAGWQVERGNIGSDAIFSAPTTNPIEVPAAGTPVMVPLHLLARLGQPGAHVTAALSWPDGTRLTNDFTLLRGEDGHGLLIGNLDWVNRLQPPTPATGPAVLELLSAGGQVLARRSLVVVSPNDPHTRRVQVYWTVSGAPDLVQPQERVVIQTPRIGTAALEELLWGPPAISQIGFQTAIPTPAAVLSYAGRGADWGPRVTLRSLSITNGVATADFSRELKAYGGGSARVKLIHDQIARTLLQFPTVHTVLIAIDGQLDALQP